MVIRPSAFDHGAPLFMIDIFMINIYTGDDFGMYIKASIEILASGERDVDPCTSLSWDGMLISVAISRSV